MPSSELTLPVYAVPIFISTAEISRLTNRKLTYYYYYCYQRQYDTSLPPDL